MHTKFIGVHYLQRRKKEKNLFRVRVGVRASHDKTFNNTR